MGSFSDLYIKGYSIGSSKNSYYEDVVNMLFTTDDFFLEEVLDDDENESYYNQGFRSNVKVCKERLEIFGTTKKKAEEEFLAIISEIRDSDEEYRIKFKNIDSIDYNYYINSIKFIINNRIEEIEDTEDDFYKYLIENNFHISSFYDELNPSTQNWLYSIFLALNDDDIIYYDLISLISNGYISEDSKDLVSNDKIIILTEGKTDTEFIKNSIELFYPHLLPFYQFISYEDTRLQGSASMLVHVIKALVGIETKNPTIAIFDNDTAGGLEIKNLKDVQLPPNLKIIQYPNIDICNSYPIQSVNGNIILGNINGIAASIEMYLGRDILLDSSDNLYPIFLSSFEHKMNQYQGALGVDAKKNIQNKFREKCKKARDQDSLPNQDWSGIDAILDLIKHIWD